MRRTLPVLIVGALLLVACSAAATAPPDEDADRGAPLPTAGQGGEQPPPLTDGEQRLIVRVGQLELQVADVPAAYRQARQLALRLGGYVGDSQFATDSADRPTATVVLRIPADRYDEALDALRPLATKVVIERSQESDVTSQVVDLNARIVNLRATEAALQKLMDRAAKVSEILEVQRELTSTREQIEQLTAQKQSLEKQAALATLTVTFETAPQPVAEVTKSWDPGADVERAVAQLVDIAQGVGRALIWLAIVVLPVAVAAGLLFGMAWLIARRLGIAIRRPGSRMAAGLPGSTPQGTLPGPPPPVDFGGSS